VRLKLVSVAVALIALWVVPSALADGGPGGAQAGAQNATTNQGALGAAASYQNAVNANVPVSIAGGNIYSDGPSSATQNATSNAKTNVANNAKTDQNQRLGQNIGGASCLAGCGGGGGFQAGIQNAQTNQLAAGAAKSDQNAVNANVPVSIAGGNVASGPSSASQTANSSANTDVSNNAETDQHQSQQQNVGGGSCLAGCGGAGGYQVGLQNAETNQAALGKADSKQNAVNANVPVSIAGGNVSAGPSSATQNATSNATTNVSNEANTDQGQYLSQNVGGGSCKLGCGGAGGFQAGIQNAQTNQLAAGAAKSDQNAVNANVPVSIAGGNIYSGPSSASQTANSSASTNVSNAANTAQDQLLCQNVGSSKGGGCDKKGREGHTLQRTDGLDGKNGCYAGCGGAGGWQAGLQNAETNQLAIGLSKSDQNAVNGNAPVSIAGGNIYSRGPSSATQNATSNATTNVSNDATTRQNQGLIQNVGGSGCYAGCGGPGGFQLGVQNSKTNQGALGLAFSDQNAVNSNAPVNVAGHDVKSGPSSADQTASSSATTNVSNTANTTQNQLLCQNVGSSSKGGGCDYGRDGVILTREEGYGGKDGKDGCYAGCGGAGGFQAGLQNAETNQLASGLSKSDQNAVNGNAPVSTAGKNIWSGPSSATQYATSNATTNVSNDAKTRQNQGLTQNVGGSGCYAGCGGAGGFQLGIQNAETNQGALGFAFSNQNAVNSNTPVSTAGGSIYGGSSSASQTPMTSANTGVGNNAETGQGQWLNQQVAPSYSAPKRLTRSPAKNTSPSPLSTPAAGARRETGTAATTPGVAGERTAQLNGVKTSAMLPFAGRSLPGALLTGLALFLLGTALRRAGRHADDGEVDTP
jgi:hypothetical protein